MTAPTNGQANDDRRAPRWLKLINPINRFFLHRGVGPAPQHVLSIVGRRTGKVRTTPVALVVVDGDRYVVAGFSGSDWVKNARAAGIGELRRGRTVQRVSLTELPIVERGRILQAFARQVPGGRSFMTVGADASPEAFSDAGKNHPVFRVDNPQVSK